MAYELVVLGNGSDWCRYSMADLAHIPHCRFSNDRFPFTKKGMMQLLLRAHHSEKLNSIFELPGKTLWYRTFSDSICKDPTQPLILVIYDRNMFANCTTFLNYLRKRFTKIKLVYVFTNVARISGASNNHFLDSLNLYYDVVYAFDPGDAPKYGFNYSPLVYSENRADDVQAHKDAFYIGRAKDRYDMLMSVFARLKSLNIPRRFYLFNVDEEKQQYKDEITYNQLIPYKTVLRYIQESDCLIDVIQGNSEGFTIKVCEAIYYNKLLITTNENIKNMPFYDSQFIRIIHSADDIDAAFFENADNVHYSDEGRKYFAVSTFLSRVFSDLKIDTD